MTKKFFKVYVSPELLLNVYILAMADSIFSLSIQVMFKKARLDSRGDKNQDKPELIKKFKSTTKI